MNIEYPFPLRFFKSAVNISKRVGSRWREPFFAFSVGTTGTMIINFLKWEPVYRRAFGKIKALQGKLQNKEAYYYYYEIPTTTLSH
jgi:hypothetical protein